MVLILLKRQKAIEPHICSPKALQELCFSPSGGEVSPKYQRRERWGRGSLGHIYLYSLEILSKHAKQNITKITAEYVTIMHSVWTIGSLVPVRVCVCVCVRERERERGNHRPSREGWEWVGEGHY